MKGAVNNNNNVDGNDDGDGISLYITITITIPRSILKDYAGIKVKVLFGALLVTRGS